MRRRESVKQSQSIFVNYCMLLLRNQRAPTRLIFWRGRSKASTTTRRRLLPGSCRPSIPFCSVPVYEGRREPLIKNAINRYLIGSPMLGHRRKNAGGSLTIYIRKDSPGRAKENNCLPAPEGPFYLYGDAVVSAKHGVG